MINSNTPPIQRHLNVVPRERQVGPAHKHGVHEQATTANELNQEPDQELEHARDQARDQTHYPEQGLDVVHALEERSPPDDHDAFCGIKSKLEGAPSFPAIKQ